MGFGSVQSMVLSTWNSEYALQWQCTKTICFCYVRHSKHLLVIFAIPKSIFIRQDRLNRLKQCLNLYMFVRFISSMELLSKGWSQERDYLAFNNRV